MVTRKNVAVILLNWNGWNDTIACLESLLAVPQDIGIFVADNASTDDSVAKIQHWANCKLPEFNKRRGSAGRAPFKFSVFDADGNGNPGQNWLEQDDSLGQITLIQTGYNLGFAGGNNVALRFALKDDYGYFWFLNNDTTVLPDSLTWLVHRMDEDPKIGICGSTLVYSDRPEVVQALGGGSFNRLKGRASAIGFGQSIDQVVNRDAVEKRMHLVSGAAMFVKRRFLCDVGLMQEDYFLYYEELDWAHRARGKYKLGYAPQSVVLHKLGASIGTNDFGERSGLSDYYLARNRIRFCYRYSRISLPFVIFDTSRDILRWCARRRWSRARLIAFALVGLPFVPSKNT